MVGEAGHRHGVRALVAAGEGEVEQVGCPAGIVAEEFIEVPHPKEHEGPRAAGLRGLKLLHHRACHGWNVAAFDQRATAAYNQSERTPMRGPCDGGL